MMFGCILTLLFLPFVFCWIFFWNTPCCSFLLSFWFVKNFHADDNLKLDLISLNLLIFRFLLLLFNLSNFKLSSLFQFFHIVLSLFQVSSIFCILFASLLNVVEWWFRGLHLVLHLGFENDDLVVDCSSNHFCRIFRMHLSNNFFLFKMR